MKRVKTKTKTGNRKVIKKASYEAVEFVVTLSEAVLRCDFDFNNNQIDEYKEKLNHYSTYFTDKALTWQELRDIIKKKESESNV